MLSLGFSRRYSFSEYLFKNLYVFLYPENLLGMSHLMFTNVLICGYAHECIDMYLYAYV